MRLVRYGDIAQEKPGLIDSVGILRDLSGHITDIDANSIDDASLERLRAIDPASLAITGERAVANLSGTLTGRKRVLLVVGGGIAAYKALEVARRLQDHHVSVTGVMTRSACEFITPLSLSALTGEKVYNELFSLTDEAEMGHIRQPRT